MRAVQQRGAASTSGDSHRGADQQNNHNAAQFTVRLGDVEHATHIGANIAADSDYAGHDGRALLPNPRQSSAKAGDQAL